MKRTSGFRFRAAAVLLALFAMAAFANVILFFPGPPGEPAGVPAYARIERAPVDGLPLVHHDRDWAAIYFFRDPACVPAGFNLLDFADAPRAFDCPMTVEGFEVWKNGPWAGDVAPIHTVSHGTGAVPVWFVCWEVLRAHLADDWLDMEELSGLDTLVRGTASYFKETLQPAELAQRTLTQVVARGVLDNGSTFDLQSVENTRSELNDIESKTVTQIRFN